MEIVQLLYFGKFCWLTGNMGKKKTAISAASCALMTAYLPLHVILDIHFKGGLAFIYSNFYSAFGWVLSTSTFLPLIFSSNSGYTRRAVAEPKTINSYNNCGSSVVLDNKRR